MVRVKSVVLAVGSALESTLLPLAPASAVSAPIGGSSVTLCGGRRIVIRKASAIGWSEVSLNFLGELRVERARAAAGVRDFELELFGDTWLARELA